MDNTITSSSEGIVDFRVVDNEAGLEEIMASILMQNDAILPDQLNYLPTEYKSSPAFVKERGLLAASFLAGIAEAVMVIVDPNTERGRYQKRLKRQAIDWVMNDVQKFGFDWYCDAFNIHPGRARAVVLKKAGVETKF